MSNQRPAVSLHRAVFWFGGSYGVAIIGYVGLSAAASRLIGPQQFGHFVVILTATMLLGQLGLLGVQRSGLREAARIRNAGSDDDLRVLREGVRAVSLVALPLVAALSGVGSWYLLKNDSSSTWFLPLLIALLVYLSGQQKLYANYLRGFGRVRLASVLEGRSGGALVSASQTVLVGMVLWLQPSWGLAGALAAVALGYALPVWLAAHLVAREWRHLRPSAGILGHLLHVMQRDWRFALVQMATYMNSTMELWIAGLLLSAIDTSMFSAGQRLSQLLAIPMTSLGIVFSPAIARLTISDRSVMESLLRTGSSLASLLTVIIWLPLVIAPGIFLSGIYGPGFTAAATTTVLLSTGLVVNALTGLSGITLIMANQEGWVAAVQWTSICLRLVAGPLTASVWGVTGLAWSAALISTITYGLMWWQAFRQMGVRTHATLRPDARLLTKVGG